MFVDKEDELLRAALFIAVVNIVNAFTKVIFRYYGSFFIEHFSMTHFDVGMLQNGLFLVLSPIAFVCFQKFLAIDTALDAKMQI